MILFVTFVDWAEKNCDVNNVTNEHTVKENECHTARFPVRRFDCFDHLYKGILKQMIPHLKALIFSYQNQV